MSGVFRESDFSDLREAFELKLIENQGFKLILEIHRHSLVFIVLNVVDAAAND